MLRVVIAGGGFGGVRTALKLANKQGIAVRLISKQSYFEYHAALYRSATGRSPLEVAIPLREFFAYARNVEVVEDTIIDVNTGSKFVGGTSGSRYAYDTLVLALGNVTEYYGIAGLQEHAYGVKTIHEALRLKRHLHEQLLNGESERHYVVIGAGATGVELSAELSAYLRKIRKKHRVKRSFTVDLIESAPRVLASMPEEFSATVERRLRQTGVKILRDTTVAAENIDSITIPRGRIQSHTVIWTAGVANNPLFAKFPEVFRANQTGRIAVDSYLQAAQDVHVIGDSAATPYAGMAQTALHDANFVADNIIRVFRNRSRRVYRPIRPVYAIPVGSRWAAVLWGNVRIYGRTGWALRRMADLRLYLTFLPLTKALTTWRYGFIDEEVCTICKQ